MGQGTGRTGVLGDRPRAEAAPGKGQEHEQDDQRLDRARRSLRRDPAEGAATVGLMASGRPARGAGGRLGRDGGHQWILAICATDRLSMSGGRGWKPTEPTSDRALWLLTTHFRKSLTCLAL